MQYAPSLKWIAFGELISQPSNRSRTFVTSAPYCASAALRYASVGAREWVGSPRQQPMTGKDQCHLA